MTKREIYEQVVSLTAELAKTKVAEEIFDSAKAGDPIKTQEAIDSFPKKYPELYAKIVSFGKSFNKLIDESATGEDGAIFGTKSDEANGIFVFDTDMIDALSFYAFTILGNMDDVYFFDNWEKDPTSEDAFFKAIEEATNEEFAEFVECYSWTDWAGDEAYATVGDLLADILVGSF